MKVAVVTGPSSGIGLATSRTLALSGYHVVAAGRSLERTRPVVAELVESGGSAEFLSLDLADLGSVRRAARSLVEAGRPVSVLINNAGIGIGRGQTVDGLELHYGVNHFGHFVFTRGLTPCFDPGTRIVTVSSAVHMRAKTIDFDRARATTRSLTGIPEYAGSKLANLLFSKELAMRHPEWRTYAVHPGLVDTALIPTWSKPLLRGRLLTPEQGADTVTWCAVSPAVAHETGLYYARRQAIDPSPAGLDRDLAERLWQASESWCDPSPAD